MLTLPDLLGLGILRGHAAPRSDFRSNVAINQSITSRRILASPCTYDGLGSLEGLHVVGDDFVLFGELHDSGLVVGETVVGALSLNLEGRQLLGNLIVPVNRKGI